MVDLNKYKCDSESIYSFHSQERCEVVRRLCVENDLWVDLVDFHFCQMKGKTLLTAPLSIVLIIVMFKLVGELCEEYMVSGVVRFIKKFKINETKAGKTLVPIVNATGDMITVIMAAVSRDDLDLAIGAMFGASLFTSCMVLSSIIYLSKASLPLDISSSKVHLDIMFYLAGCIIMVACNQIGMTFLPFSCIFISMFFIYIYIASNLTNNKSNPEIEIAPGSLDRREKESFAVLKDIFEIEKENTKVLDIQSVENKEKGMKENEGLLETDHAEYDHESGVFGRIKNFYLQKWNDSNLFFKILFILGIPIRVLIEFTVPPVDHKLYHPYQKFIYPITTPLASIVLLNAHRFSLDLIVFEVDAWLFTFSLGTLVAIYLIVTNKDTSITPTPENFYLILSLIGSALRITFLVKLVLNAVKLLQLVTGISKIVLGTLVISLGSCYPDLIINMSLVKRGMSIVAVANAFSAELINLFLGFGLSCLTLFFVGGRESSPLELFDWKLKSDSLLIFTLGSAFMNQVYLLVKVIFINGSKLYLHDAYTGLLVYLGFVSILIIAEIYI